jgi:hypothetical protein
MLRRHAPLLLHNLLPLQAMVRNQRANQKAQRHGNRAHQKHPPESLLVGENGLLRVRRRHASVRRFRERRRAQRLLIVRQRGVEDVCEDH